MAALSGHQRRVLIAVAVTAVVIGGLPAPAVGAAPTAAARPAATPSSAAPGALVPTGKPLSGTVTGGGHTITYTVGGASVPTGALASSYDGVVTAGAGVWLSGSATFTMGLPGVTDLSQRATLEGEQKEYSESITGPATRTMQFSLSTTAPTGTPDTTGVVRTIYATVSSMNCGGICEGAQISIALAVVSAAQPPSPPPPPPSGDTTDPVVRMRSTHGITRVDDRTPMHFSISDDSGKAAWDVGLYSDGAKIAYGHSTGFVRANGEWRTGTWGYPRTAPGPFFMCVWAEDAAGNRSANAPYSACRWVSIQVPMSRVSNGCGGSDWGAAALEWMNWFGNMRYYGPRDIPVHMKPACDKHDAAYGGATVAGIRTRKPIDYRRWTRDEIDTQFAQDLQHQCVRALKGPRHRAELKECKGEVETYLALVRKWGVSVYDTDVSTPGTQATAPPTTVPPGGGRVNN